MRTRLRRATGLDHFGALEELAHVAPIGLLTRHVVVPCFEREELAVPGDALDTAAAAEGHGVDARVALAANGALPRTSSGKLSRAKTRAFYLDGVFDVKPLR